MNNKCLQCDLSLDSPAEVWACSHDCTFCTVCTKANNGICKNCGETLQQRKNSDDIHT